MSEPPVSDADRQGGGAPLWTAIILAGQRPEGDPQAAHCKAPFKALIPIDRQTMLGHVARALLAAHVAIRSCTKSTVMDFPKSGT